MSFFPAARGMFAQDGWSQGANQGFSSKHRPPGIAKTRWLKLPQKHTAEKTTPTGPVQDGIASRAEGPKDGTVSKTLPDHVIIDLGLKIPKWSICWESSLVVFYLFMGEREGHTSEKWDIQSQFYLQLWGALGLIRNFPGGPVVKTLHSQYRRPGFSFWSGN